MQKDIEWSDGDLRLIDSISRLPGYNKTVVMAFKRYNDALRRTKLMSYTAELVKNTSALAETLFNSKYPQEIKDLT